MYRVGNTGSSAPESVAATNQARLYGGYPQQNSSYGGNNIGTPVFRSVPERWIVMRTIRPAALGQNPGKIMARWGNEELEVPSSNYNNVAGDSGCIRNLFVVQSVSNSSFLVLFSADIHM